MNNNGKKGRPPGRQATQMTEPWVPSGAAIHVDLLGGDPQGRAWNDGSEAAVSSLIGADANTEGAWGVTLYEPTNLVANGYFGAPIAFLGDARDMMLSGAKAVFTFYEGDTSSGHNIVAISADGQNAIQVDVITTSEKKVAGYSWNGSGGTLSIETDAVVNYTSGGGAINEVTVVLVPDRLDIACNGSDVVSGAVSEDDRPPANPLVAFLVEIGQSNRLQAITLYPAA